MMGNDDDDDDDGDNVDDDNVANADGLIVFAIRTRLYHALATSPHFPFNLSSLQLVILGRDAAAILQPLYTCLMHNFDAAWIIIAEKKTLAMPNVAAISLDTSAEE